MTGLALGAAIGGCSDSGTTGSSATGSGAAASAASGTASGASSEVVALIPAAIRSRGTLQVGTEAKYPPFEFREPGSDVIVGSDADLAARIADLMGLKVTFTEAEFDTLLPSLAQGKYDLVMSALTITAEREQTADFVTYHYEGDGALVRGGNPKRLGINTTLCGLQVAVLRGSTQQANSVPLLNQACSGARRPPLKPVEAASADQLTPLLTSGRVDAILTDGSNAAYTAAHSAGALDFAPGKPFNPAPFGIAAPKGNGMAQAVQKALQTMIADGSYRQILATWGLQAGAIQTPKINEVSG